MPEGGGSIVPFAAGPSGHQPCLPRLPERDGCGTDTRTGPIWTAQVATASESERLALTGQAATARRHVRSASR
jgi:hypothetical protein